jgi:hypothetical protein
METYLTSATQVIDWLVANADRIGLAIALIVAAYLKWRGGKEAGAKAALIDVIEDVGGRLVSRVITGPEDKLRAAGDPVAAVAAVKAAIKREVAGKGLPSIDRAVAALKEKKS